MEKSGVLQIFDNTSSSWSTVCRHDFTEVEATVVCKSFGFGMGTVLPARVFGSVGSTGDMIRRKISCTGPEKDIRDCQYLPQDVFCDSYDDYVSITCFDTKEIGQF